uniref:Uncharacterized protein n=1 Tax=Panagrolaimus superbus TaxID=310955 RepID=A0A914XTE9_9BILA
MCEEKCNELSEICVENDQLVQKCNKLPKECSKALEAFVNPPKLLVSQKSSWNLLPRIQQRQKQWNENHRRSVSRVL